MSIIEQAIGKFTEPPRVQDHGAVVSIPFDNLAQSGFLTPANTRSRTAEEFRAIKRPLLKNITTRNSPRIENANLIMVTSALEGDGKTFCSINLAISMAMEQDKTVVFIDADVLKATAGNIMGIPDGTAGLIDALMDSSVDPEDLIIPTNMEKLSILPAGRPHERATELLAGSDMKHLMMGLSARYTDRVIVFDSPPLLRTSESAVLASFMGQIVFVAAANSTPQHAVHEALELLGEDKMVAVMLNKAPRHQFPLLGISQDYTYGAGYGYSSRLEGSNSVSVAPTK